MLIFLVALLSAFIIYFVTKDDFPTEACLAISGLFFLLVIGGFSL